MPGRALAAALLLAALPARAADPDVQLREDLAAAGIVPLPQAPLQPEAQVALGKALFYDKLLSGNRDISCAACHPADHHAADGLPVSMGTRGRGHGPRRAGPADRLAWRNAPALYNLWLPEAATLFWDGHAARDPKTGGFRLQVSGGEAVPVAVSRALAAQALAPIAGRYEMRGADDDPGNELARAGAAEGPPGVWRGVMARLKAVPAYRALFAAAYPAERDFDVLTATHAAEAIAAFETAAFVADGTPLDRYLAGDDAALSAAQKRGARVFLGRGRCAACHRGRLLSDFKFHVLAAPQIGPGGRGEGAVEGDDRGKGETTWDPADFYAFRTPPLRNVAVTGPWMHDGAFAKLEDAVRHHLDPVESVRRYDPALSGRPEVALFYDGEGERARARLRRLDPALPKSGLSPAELAEVLAFLGALTDPAPPSALSLPPKNSPSGLTLDD